MYSTNMADCQGKRPGWRVGPWRTPQVHDTPEGLDHGGRWVRHRPPIIRRRCAGREPSTRLGGRVWETRLWGRQYDRHADGLVETQNLASTADPATRRLSLPGTGGSGVQGADPNECESHAGVRTLHSEFRADEATPRRHPQSDKRMPGVTPAEGTHARTATHRDVRRCATTSDGPLANTLLPSSWSFAYNAGWIRRLLTCFEVNKAST
jgi:hypothetical protein